MPVSALIDRIKHELRKPLPGRLAHRNMAPPWSLHTLEEEIGYRRASVLILLYDDEGLTRFPLIVRSAGPGPHGGQIALPGGAVEGSETDEEAALRETVEELGIDASAVEILGTLTPFGVAVSRFRLAPVVAYCPFRPVFRPAPAEVAECFTVSTAELRAPSSKSEALVSHAGTERNVPCYRFSARVVWGATAIILAEFEAVIARAIAS